MKGTQKGTKMTMPEEIEDAMRNGCHPLFLHGIIQLAEAGDGKLLTEIIDQVGQRLYLGEGHELDQTDC